MGFTQKQASDALGLSRTTVVNYDLGKRCDVEGPVVVTKVVLLACNAIENKLPPIS